MPNWCSNYLDIQGNKKAIKAFKERATSKDGKKDISFTNFIPLPEKEDKNWYDWCHTNWGTKWDACNSTLDNEDYNSLGYNFDTAWGPPIPFIITVSGMYPSLEFHMEFEEGGCSIYGKVLYKDKKCLMDKDYTYEEYLEKNMDYVAYKEEVLKMTSPQALTAFKEDEYQIEMWSPIEQVLLSRVADKDLPLFINKEWNDSNAEEMFHKRLKGGS